MLKAIWATVRSSSCSRNEPRDPVVERAHRRAAPDLVVDPAIRCRRRSPSGSTGRGTSGRPAPSGASASGAARSSCAGSRSVKKRRVSSQTDASGAERFRVRAGPARPRGWLRASRRGRRARYSLRGAHARTSCRASAPGPSRPSRTCRRPVPSPRRRRPRWPAAVCRAATGRTRRRLVDRAGHDVGRAERERAATAAGVPMPPAAPTRTGRA